MSERTLEERLERAGEKLTAAQQALEYATAKEDRARELGGGLLSFGGSGPQRARQQVRAASDSAARAYYEASKRVEHWAGKVDRLKALIAKRDTIPLTRDQLEGAVLVRDQFGWHKVVRLNQKTVTVATNYSWTDLIRINKIIEYRSIP